MKKYKNKQMNQLIVKQLIYTLKWGIELWLN